MCNCCIFLWMWLKCEIIIFHVQLLCCFWWMWLKGENYYIPYMIVILFQVEVGLWGVCVWFERCVTPAKRKHPYFWIKLYVIEIIVDC